MLSLKPFHLVISRQYYNSASHLFFGTLFFSNCQREEVHFMLFFSIVQSLKLTPMPVQNYFGDFVYDRQISQFGILAECNVEMCSSKMKLFQYFACKVRQPPPPWIQRIECYLVFIYLENTGLKIVFIYFRFNHTYVQLKSNCLLCSF